MDLRPVLYVIGIFLSIMAISMVLPMLTDLYFGHEDWRAFFICIIITAFFGGSLILSNAGKSFSLSLRQAFLLTTLSWVTLSIFAALPFWLSALKLSYTDAFFEAMSGITTTGSTVIVGLDSAPPGILLWRSLLQWLGGIGIIIMALSILPFLKVGGMQIFRTELSENDKALPRLAQLANSIGMIYLLLTLIATLLLIFAGMNMLEALAHAMSAISTGGFSTFDASLSNQPTAWPEIIIIVVMLIGSLPFVLYLKAVRGNISPLLRDSQVRAFFAIVSLSIIMISSYLMHQQSMTFLEALRHSSFTVISLITGTGFSNGDYNVWGSFPVSLLFFLMVVGGCAGSTSCGIKIFRFQVLFAVSKVQIRKLLHPHGVFLPHYNGKPIPKDVPLSVMGFFFMYALCFTLLAVALSYCGLDFISAMSGAATAISNVGPGLGNIIGPNGTFQSLPDSAKWLLSAGMLLGRLEIFTVLVLFAPRFWRN